MLRSAFLNVVHEDISPTCHWYICTFGSYDGNTLGNFSVRRILNTLHLSRWKRSCHLSEQASSLSTTLCGLSRSFSVPLVFTSFQIFLFVSSANRLITPHMTTYENDEEYGPEYTAFCYSSCDVNPCSIETRYTCHTPFPMGNLSVVTPFVL